MLPTQLDPVAIRVLAALVEKALSTPDHYPLSLNALTNACNQVSNRDPVMTLDEGTVSRTLDGLRRQSLVRSFQGIGSRVPKFQHLLAEAADLSPSEQAIWCVLALRGAQTMAEIRTRAARLMQHEDGDSVEAAVEALVAREPSPIVTRLPRRSGQKEARFAQLLGGDIADETAHATPLAADSEPPPPVGQGTTAATDRIGALEEQVRELRAEVTDLRAQLESFRKQFE